MRRDLGLLLAGIPSPLSRAPRASAARGPLSLPFVPSLPPPTLSSHPFPTSPLAPCTLSPSPSHPPEEVLMGRRWNGGGRRRVLDLGDLGETHIGAEETHRTAEEPPGAAANAPGAVGAALNPLLGLLGEYDEDEVDEPPALPPAASAAWTEWQACLDHSSQAYYYWNTRTNEVRWTPPEELLTLSQPPADSQSLSTTKVEQAAVMKVEQAAVPAGEGPLVAVENSGDERSQPACHSCVVDAERTESSCPLVAAPGGMGQSSMGTDMQASKTQREDTKCRAGNNIYEQTEVIREPSETADATGSCPVNTAQENHGHQFGATTQTSIAASCTTLRAAGATSCSGDGAQRRTSSDGTELSSTVAHVPPETSSPYSDNLRLSIITVVDDLSCKLPRLREALLQSAAKVNEKAQPCRVADISHGTSTSAAIPTGARGNDVAILVPSSQPGDASVSTLDDGLDGASTSAAEVLAAAATAPDATGGCTGAMQVLRLLHRLEVRREDWAAGALDPGYFRRTLHGMVPQVSELESFGLPQGWTRTWDASSRKYYFANAQTGAAQWNEPGASGSSSDSGPYQVGVTEAELTLSDLEEGEVSPTAKPRQTVNLMAKGGDTTSAGQSEKGKAGGEGVSDEEWIRRTAAHVPIHPERMALLRERAGSMVGVSTGVAVNSTLTSSHRSTSPNFVVQNVAECTTSGHDGVVSTTHAGVE